VTLGPLLFHNVMQKVANIVSVTPPTSGDWVELANMPVMVRECLLQKINRMRVQSTKFLAYRA